MSNFYLSKNEQLGEVQHDLLLEFGWISPCNLPDEFGHEPVGSLKYFLHLEYRSFADSGVGSAGRR